MRELNVNSKQSRIEQCRAVAVIAIELNCWPRCLDNGCAHGPLADVEDAQAVRFRREQGQPGALPLMIEGMGFVACSEGRLGRRPPRQAAPFPEYGRTARTRVERCWSRFGPREGRRPI